MNKFITGAALENAKIYFAKDAKIMMEIEIALTNLKLNQHLKNVIAFTCNLELIVIAETGKDLFKKVYYNWKKAI